MIMFNSDIDNTLIYSYKHDIGSEKKCVEVYQGREISFMPFSAYRNLPKICEKYLFVPTTTRSIEQYHRIDFGIPKPQYALVCNGGVLLKNGELDLDWYEESLDLKAPLHAELTKAVHYLKSDPYISFEIRTISDLFLFTKSNKVQETIDHLKNVVDLTRTDVFSQGTKVYVLPKALNKGNAVSRLKKRLGPEFIIAAGDSEFDVPMLKTADISYAPESLRKYFKPDSNVKFMSESLLFSEQLLECLLKSDQ